MPLNIKLSYLLNLTRKSCLQIVLFFLYHSIGIVSLYSQTSEAEGIKIENCDYVNLAILDSIPDRHPEIFKIKYLRVPTPTDYWFKEHIGAYLNINLDYIRLYSKRQMLEQKEDVSHFEVFMSNEGIIDSVSTLNHDFSSISENKIIRLLKSCRWKPALLNMKPVDVHFIMEFKFVE